MTNRKPFAVLAAKAKADPVRRARIATYKRAMDDSLALAELRAVRGLTQTEVAETLGVTQANISRIEHEEDLYLSTLRGYVQGLGGELEVNAVFPEGKVAFNAEDQGSEMTRAGDWASFAAASRGASLPAVVEAHLRADRNLDSGTATLLSRMFRAAYSEFAEADRIGADENVESSDRETTEKA